MINNLSSIEGHVFLILIVQMQIINLLRDYYMASSYNSCCGGNTEKDFVDMIPLQQVIGRGARY